MRAGTLCAIPLTAGGFTRRWYSATRAVKNKPPYLREFEQFVARAVNGAPESAPAISSISPRSLTLAS